MTRSFTRVDNAGVRRAVDGIPLVDTLPHVKLAVHMALHYTVGRDS